MSNTSPSEPHRNIHLLSKKSKAYERDLFLFYQGDGNSFALCGGLNLKRHKLTIAQFYNWMDILDEDEPKPNPMIWRVEVSRFDVLCYTSNRIGNALSRTSNEFMEPGEYAPFDDENPGIKVIGSWPKPTFRGRENIVRERMKNYPRAGLRLDHNNWTKEILDEVQARDKGICWFTGDAANSITTSWIVPPAWSEEVHPSDDPQKLGNMTVVNEHRVSENAVTLSETLADEFLDNKFGVDVDDQYRIVIFQNLPEGITLKEYLPAKFIAISKENGDKFLREQFKWCLGVHFLGGDISEDYSHGWAWHIANEAEENGIDPDDPIWKTDLGREILEVSRERGALDESMFELCK